MIRFGPPPYTAPVLAAVGVVLAVLAAGSDAEGRVLLAVAAAGVLAGAAWLLGGAPLSADAEGVAVRGVVRTHRLAWAEVIAVGVDSRRRSRAVEIETADDVFAVPAILLGRARPAEARAALERLRPPG